MQRALQDGKRPFYAADIWLSVNNGMIDTKEDFDASVSQTHMDFAAKPNFARLAIQQGAFNINQTAYNTWQEGYIPNWYYYHFQGFTVTPGRQLTKITVKIDNTAGGIKTFPIKILKGAIPLGLSPADSSYANWISSHLVTTQTCTVAAGYSGEVSVSFDAVDLPEGAYTLFFLPPYPTKVAYQNSDVYSGGQLDVYAYRSYGGVIGFDWTYNKGDLYFKLELSGYYHTGTFSSKIMDLGEVPIYPGSFQMTYDLPVGTSLIVNLTGSNNADMSSGISYTNINDGQEITAFRYWQTDNTLFTDSTLYQTPLIDLQEVLFPKDRLRIREKVKLFNVDDSIGKNYQALLNPLEFTTSEINLIDRVSTGGSASAVLEERTGEVIQRILSDSPLMNHRVMLYMGCDVPGFQESDLLRFFIGSVSAASYKPGYRGGVYQLPLTFKNPVLEFKRKVPQMTQTGLLNFEILSLNYDKWHVIDASIDVIRGKAGIPGRYVNLATISSAKSSIGDANLPSAAFLVRRSNVLSDYVPRWKSESAGNGTIDNTLLGKQPDVLLGDYKLVCKTVAAGGGVFSVTNPVGTALADATVNVAYGGTQLNFTILSGTVDFALGDKITISVISPDTRISQPTESVEILKALATIADGYFTSDESSRIAFVKHDFNATSEATWADEDLVKAGVDAVPIMGMDDCNPGYDKYLFNTAICGNEWDGSGSGWVGMGHTYAAANADSIDDFAPGQDKFYSIMEKNLQGPSQWLGPENGYNGETIAQWLAGKMVARFAYPPVVITGALLPLSEFMRTQGSVVTIWSKRFTKFRRRGIALSESKKFMVLSKKLDNSRTKCIFNLVELT